MTLKLKDKVAVVTGASKGIGAGIAKAYASAGAKVVVNYAKDSSSAEKVVNHIIGLGGKAIAVQADVSKPADVERLFEQAIAAFDKVDILVNNAGIYDVVMLEALTIEVLQANINTNLIGTILCAQKAAEVMGTDGGNIINISSTVSINPMPGTLIYAATKAAVDNVTKVLAKELGTKKIRVNTISPGITETEGAHEQGFMGGEWEAQLVKQVPLGRIGQPDDIAKVAVFLASDDAGWVTGERIQVAGGQI
ncbi:3-oxoacyl-[acyl-carrier protein] reductase [Pedobacter psychrotolerans]|uniref:3-oxoacyl-[acyl-carrier protein] reductase n=1 Tax=Pedobacter psychrotolerans TaxID=1843235 RepID=A0A4R2HN21_9SPHI|nr:glucose 1-dehydrogenase [Pedobacter psychrotolerans]TCO31122.1 3-oxoacyl-[acyl-carrier protein] reductase [Pedobacter psychrotolerans]GGE42075.1 oxidoreductase [Pedobacter psychrotolerans]